MSRLRLLRAVALVVCLVFAGVVSGVSAEGGTNCTLNTANDVAVLNFALTLENLDSTFFSTYQAKFTAQDFVNAGFSADVRDRLELIRQHEIAHADTLRQAITARNGVPVPPCQYTFPVTDVKSYVAVGATLENVGVTAYDGGINGLSDPGLQQVAATIATVEARHAAYLNRLNGIFDAPEAADAARTPAEVVQAAKPFVVSCPYAWNDTSVLPTIRPNGAAYITVQPQPPQANSTLQRGTYTLQQFTNDLDALNYALSLENLEAAFYQQGLARFDSSAFQAGGYNASVRDRIVLIGAHEQAHVSALNTIILARGAQAAQPCTYNFPLDSVKTFILTAQTLENTGVSAYDGAVNGLTDTGLQEAAATIATVEGRHAAFLNDLVEPGTFSGPAMDTALTPAQVLAKASAFIVSCPTPPPQPTVAPQALTPCPPARAATPLKQASCALTNLQVGTDGTLAPAFTQGTTQYQFSSSTGSTTITATPAVSGATISIIDGDQSTTLTAGQPSAPLSTSTTLRVSVPSVVLALGDSITFGETDLSYTPSDGNRGYVSGLANALDTLNGNAPAPMVVNLAIDGETVNSFVSGSGRLTPVQGRSDAILAAQNTHYIGRETVSQLAMMQEAITNASTAGMIIGTVTITLGFNDLGTLSNQPGGVKIALATIAQLLADYRSGYRTILTIIRAALPDANLIMPLYYNPFPADPSSPAQPIFTTGGGMLNAVISELAKEFNGMVVDTFSPFLGREAELTYLNEQPHGFTLSGPQGGVEPIGNVHPTEQGYAVITNAVVFQLSKMNLTSTADCSTDYTLTLVDAGALNDNGDGAGAGAGTDGSDGSESDSGAGAGAGGAGAGAGAGAGNTSDGMATATWSSLVVLVVMMVASLHTIAI